MPGQVVDLGDHAAGQKIIRGSGPEQMFVAAICCSSAQLHSDKVEVFRIDQNPADPSQILTEMGIEFTGGITPQGIAVSPDGSTVYVANMQTEDISFLGVDADWPADAAGLRRRSASPTTRPTRPRGEQRRQPVRHRRGAGLRWLFTQSYSDDGQKSCGYCHWQSRQDGGQWNVGGNAIGGAKVCPQNKDISDNWPEWYEGLSNDMMAYASSCNGELVVAGAADGAVPAGGAGRSAARPRRVRAAEDRGELARDRPPRAERQGLQGRLLRHGVPADPVDPERDPPACRIR